MSNTKKEIEQSLKTFYSKDIKKFESIIIDAELEPIKCKFNGDNTAVINTANYNYITLTPQNLRDILKKIT